MLSWLENCRGESDPWKVTSVEHRDENGQPRTFALKCFRGYQRRQRLVEWICANVAYFLDIGAPEPVLLTVTPEFLQSLRDLAPFQLQDERPAKLDAATEGRHIGISWVNNAVPLARQPGALSSLADVHQPADILGTDVLVQNTDRHNTNILVLPRAQFGRPAHALLPIDWNLSMDGGLEPGSQELNLVASSEEVGPYAPRRVLCDQIFRSEDFDRICGRMRDLLDNPARLRSLVAWLPPEWEIPLVWRDATMEYLLLRLRVVEERLRRADDPEAAFPNWQEPLIA